jgi:FlaA1/EpsC-like NDP-sugar epimerase
MSKTRLLVVGAGGHGRSVAEAAEMSCHFNVVGFLDDSLPVGDTTLGVHVLGPKRACLNIGPLLTKLS